MANTKLHVYFDQGGMFGKGLLHISETPLDLSDEDKDPHGNHISNYFFGEVTGFYQKSCLYLFLICFKDKYGLIVLKGSLDLDFLGPKQY